jgi:hypothetical protein
MTDHPRSVLFADYADCEHLAFGRPADGVLLITINRP